MSIQFSEVNVWRDGRKVGEFLSDYLFHAGVFYPDNPRIPAIEIGGDMQEMRNTIIEYVLRKDL